MTKAEEYIMEQILISIRERCLDGKGLHDTYKAMRDAYDNHQNREARHIAHGVTRKMSR